MKYTPSNYKDTIIFIVGGYYNSYGYIYDTL
jgi:hypothetical protein